MHYLYKERMLHHLLKDPALAEQVPGPGLEVWLSVIGALNGEKYKDSEREEVKIFLIP